MAKRRFKLPGVHELSKLQEAARALPKEGPHLVIGGPGTGKSVLALLRAHRHERDGDDYLFLVYNKLLHQASKQQFDGQLVSQQWQSWFMKYFRTKTGERVPMCPADRRGWQLIDWDAVLQIIQSHALESDSELRPYLVIDEGQDMPKEFYQTLMELGFENFFVVADANQQITDENSHPTRDIAPMFLYEPQFGPDGSPMEDDRGVPILERENDRGAKERLIALYDNFRNTRPIAELACAFHTGDLSSPPADLPELSAARGSVRTPLLFEYSDEDHQFERVISRVLKMVDIKPSYLIGIISPNHNVRQHYVSELMRNNDQLDHGKPNIQTYDDRNASLRFDEGGVMVINAQACKGLEFDVVFLADIDGYSYNEQRADQLKRLFYVMVARARERIILLKRANHHCSVCQILPNDPLILERK